MYTELDPREDMQPHLPRILNRELFYKGQTIIEQGAGGFNAYYIEKGKVAVVAHEGRHRVKLCELGPGEIFGEMALILQQDRSAAVIAMSDVTVTVISAPELERKVNKINDKAIRALMKIFLNRLRDANAGQLRQYRNLASFQDRMAGLVEKAGHGIDENRRDSFRNEVEPLLGRLDELLDDYRA